MTDTQVRPAPYPADTLAKGWRFEVDMEKVKRSDTWLRAKSGEIRGALLLLWGESWQQTPCGTLPNDDELVALIIDMPLVRFQKNRGVLLRGWWLADDGRLYHDTITERVLAMLEKRAKDAERSANRRARAAASTGDPPEVTPASRVTHDGLSSEFDTKHQAPEPVSPSLRSGEPRATRRCPAAFEVTDDMRQWAQTECPQVDLARETAKFRDHTFKSPISAWPGAWRNWMRRSAEGAGAGRTRTAAAGKHSAAAAAFFPQPIHDSEVIDVR